MTLSLLPMVNLGVAPTAQGQQVLQGVVPQLLGCGHASPINVVDMQILRGSAVLAGEVVTFKGFLPVATKVVVVKRFAPVFLSLGILRQDLTCIQRSALLQASRAVLLWPRCVSEIGTALNALQRAAHCYCPFLLAKAPQVKRVLLPLVGRTAFGTTLLHRAGGLIRHRTDDALALLESAASLAVSSQSARLASLEIGRCLRNLCSAVGALKDAVLSPLHNLNPTLSVL